MAEQNTLSLLDSLKSQDEFIEAIVVTAKFVVAYLLQQDGSNPGWRKANIEGPVYLVRRRQAPRYQLLVKNQFSTNDLLDALHPDWELDCQKHYVFYKVEGDSKRIRGLWFHEDSERLKVESHLKKAIEEVKAAQNAPRKEEEQWTEQWMHQPFESHPQHPHQKEPETRYPKPDSGQAQRASMQPGPTRRQQLPSVVVTKQSLSVALHQLADDQDFLNMVMMKLKECGK